MKKESIKVLQNGLDSLITKYDILIKGNNFNEALNVMKNVELVTRVIRELQSLRENTITTTTDFKENWYDVLKFFIETKQSQLIELNYLIKENEVKHRTSGKTTALLRLSNDYKIPILVKNYESEHKDLERLANNLDLNIRVVDIKMLNMKQYENVDILLVDENTNMDNIILRGSNILKTIIGFKMKI